MTKNRVMELFERKHNKVEILWDALDEMQSHNDRSKIECVALAMGVDITEES